MSKDSKLLKNTVFNVIYNLCNMLFPLITSMYISRILMREGIGNISYAQNIASYFVTFAALGLPTYGVREIAKARGSQLNTNKTFTELFLINAVSTALASVIYCILIASSFHNSLDTELTICFGCSILFNFINIDWFYQGKEEYVYIACRSIIVKIISLLCTILFVKTKDDYLKYAIILVAASGSNYIFNIFHVRKYVRLDFHDLKFKQHLTPLFVLALSIFLSTVYSKIDITMLGTMSTKAATGVYSNAHKIIDMIIVACTAISAVFLPRLSYYYNRDKKEFTGLIDLGIRILSFVTVPVTAGLFILSSQAVELLYGSDFSAASLTIRIFSILIIIKGFGNLLCYQLIICTGNEKKRLPAYLAAAVINVVLNAVLIPRYNENGAAVASVISEITVNLYQFISVKKIVDIPFPKKAIWQSVISTAVMSAAVLLFTSFTNLPMLAECILAVGIGAVTYLAVNLIMKNQFLFDCIMKMKGKLSK